MTPETIADGVVASFHFVLRDQDSVVLDDSRARGEPMLYLHGAGNVVRGLERALEGRQVGDSFSITVPPREGYGERQGPPLDVPREVFPADAPLDPGSQFMTHTAEGRPMMLWVVRLDGDRVWVDPHHPLAGRTLRYDIDVLAMRGSTPSERDAGRPEWGVDIA